MIRNVRMLITGCALLFFCSVIFSFPQKLFATPPQALTIFYDFSSQILTVTITHKSLMTSFHYIKHVKIKKNGLHVSDNVYDNQPDPQKFTYKYELPATVGDKLEVTADCSLWGYKIVDFVVVQ